MTHKKGGLLEFSNGLWWEDPLTGDLVCEVRTIRGIRQVVVLRQVVVPAKRVLEVDADSEDDGAQVGEAG